VKASILLNILSHLPADAEIVLGEAESAIAEEFRKLVSILLNILSHLPADAEIALGDAESAIAEEFRKLMPASVADKILPVAPPSDKAKTE
jgi:hypothetical protein